MCLLRMMIGRIKSLILLCDQYIVGPWPMFALCLFSLLEWCLLYFWPCHPWRSTTHTAGPSSFYSFTLITRSSGKGPLSCQFPAPVPGTAPQGLNYFLAAVSYICGRLISVRVPSLSLRPVNCPFLGKTVWPLPVSCLLFGILMVRSPSGICCHRWGLQRGWWSVPERLFPPFIKKFPAGEEVIVGHKC